MLDNDLFHVLLFLLVRKVLISQKTVIYEENLNYLRILSVKTAFKLELYERYGVGEIIRLAAPV